MSKEHPVWPVGKIEFGRDNMIRLSPLEKSRPVSRIEWEQRGRIQELTKALEEARTCLRDTMKTVKSEYPNMTTGKEWQRWQAALGEK